IHLTKEDCNNILQKALEEFPIADLEISLPEYISVLGDDIEIKKQISESIKSVEEKYNKVKDVEKICTNLRKTNLYSDVKLELLDASSGKATISLMVDDSIYKEIIDTLLGDNIKSQADFIKYLYVSKKANEVYSQVYSAIEEAKETGYGVSVPKIEDMHLLPPEVVKKNGMYGVKLAAKAKCIHMVAVDIESSFTPIIGSLDQSKMMIDSLQNNAVENEIWSKEFFGRKLSDIVNDSMKSKIHSLPDRSKDKIKNVLDKIMNSERNNLIAIIL
ncbi:MAG: stage IV sporulation protein A, partial [Anaeroplasma sp.]|nr:stage IV sporulation protein A [Anaeroplasma sp.]